ncbi:alpha/beta hydrolase fold domain-containing protein [Alienimonas sp. DA493]|uniref:alpha/beta hydrolase fold domain-containing protein n=1 Tax=Alienimonas sp. DA493 TaxID=3373605 RepID=UPI0037550928
MLRFSFAAALCLVAAPGFAQHDHGGHAGHDLPGMTAEKPKPPTVFLDKSPRIVEYQLKRLDDARLLLVERDTTDPKYAPVYEAIVSRPGVSPKERAAALAGLVELNASDAVTELLRVLEPLGEEDRGDRRAADQLTKLLLEQPVDALAAKADALTEATTAENRPLRVAAFAALIQAGEFSDRNSGAAVDWLAAVPLVPSEDARNGLREEVVGLLGAQEPAVKQAAIAALAAIPAERADTFVRLAPLLKNPALRPTAVRTLLTVPAEDRNPAVSAAAAAVLVELAENTAAADRTTDDFLNAMQLADGLFARLPVEEAKALRSRLREVTVRVVRVKTVEEEMRYDLPYFAVEAGRPVQIWLENEDLMPHNLVVTAPGQLRDVAQRGMEVGPQGGSAGNPYVPDGDDVLFATELVAAHADSRLTFTAPEEPGEYPYVCTFPRHWMRMYGVMVVVPDLDAWLANPTVPEDPIGNTREFVQKWTVNDLLPEGADAEQKLAGRSPEIGQRIFTEATCAQCHRSDSAESLVGPSLVGVFERWKGDERKVLREMLDPSAHVDPKYAVRQVLTLDGQVFTGLVVAENEDSVSILSDPEAKEPTVIQRDDVLDMVQSDVSLMPKALLDRFTEDEIFELLAYLRGLEPGAAVDAAMAPAESNAGTAAMPPALPEGKRPQNFQELKAALAPLGYEVVRPNLEPAEGVTERLGVTFAERETGPLKLDLYLPGPNAKPGEEPPLVVLIHGGGWRKGDRGGERNKALWLAERGYAAATIDYRLADTAKFPAAIEDVRSAVQFLRSKAGEYGYDEDRFAAVGSSAGAHLAALLAAMNPPAEEQEGIDAVSARVQAAVVIAGPTDTESERAIESSRRPDSNYRLFLGGTYDEVPEQYTAASPAHWATADAPPMLLIGENSLDSFESLRGKLSNLGVSVDTFVLTGGLHGEWNWEPWFTPTMERIDAFLQKAWQSGDVSQR